MATVTAAPPAGGGPGQTDIEFVGRPDQHRKRMARLGWMFTSPALIFIGAVTLFPIAFAILLSFENVNVTGSGFQLNGLTTANYSLVLQNSTWHYALGFTLFFTAVTVLIELALGTMIALVLERLIAGRGWMMALLLVPWSLITVISATLWKYIYDPTFGIADSILNSLGLGNPTILGSNVGAIVAMIIADVWKTTPFVAIIVLAGLVMLPQDVYEAADVDGASGWTTFWKITFPLLRPTIALAVLFRILQAFGLFDLPFVLTQGGPGHATTSLAVLGYQAMFQNLAFGPGAAVATTTAVLVVIGCMVFLRVFKAQVGEEES
jgi:multiple sugar transport system permease protein